MKRLCLILCLLSLSLTSWGGPVIRWLSEVHDFGLIREDDGKVSCTFRLVNVGDTALIITSVRTSCGCTASEFDRAPIAVGDTSSVTVTYNPARRPGSFSKEIFVFTNAKPNRSMLKICGNVLAGEETLTNRYPVAIGELRLESASMPMGEVKRGKSRNAYINALNNSADTLIVRFDDAPEHLRPRAIPDTIAPGMSPVLSVHFLSDLAPQWGLNIDTLRLSVAPIGGPAVTGEVFTMAQVVDDFQKLTDEQRASAPHIGVSTELLNDFTRQRDGTLKATLTVTNTGRNELEIRRLWCPEAGVSATAERQSLKRGKKTVVTVTVDPARVETDLLNTQLTIITNDPDNSDKTIRLATKVQP